MSHVPVAKKVFANILEKESRLLDLEALAGVPAGTLPMDHPVNSLPAETIDPGHQTFVHQDISVPPPIRNVRRKFTRNTEHFTMRVNQLMERNGLRDPLQVLMEIATGKESIERVDPVSGEMTYQLKEFEKKPDHKTRALAAAEIASYLYPKRKAIEVSGTEGQPISFNIIADESPIAEMPSEEAIALLIKQRRQEAAKNEEDRKTIQGL